MEEEGCLGRSSRLFEFPVFPTRFITRPIYPSIGVSSCPRYVRTHMYEFHEILGRKEKGRGRFSVISLGSLSRSPRHGIVLALRPGIVARSPIGVASSMQGACTLIARNAISNSMQEPI